VGESDRLRWPRTSEISASGGKSESTAREAVFEAAGLGGGETGVSLRVSSQEGKRGEETAHLASSVPSRL
jgi:hypothetical protein